MKKILALTLCILFAFNLAGCAKKVDSSSVAEVSEESEAPAKPTLFVNPLTGLEELTAEQVSLRPVAIMINNIGIAQPVQTGLTKADIVYETEVEGGITRLMAVFKNIKNVDRIGSVRSARYPYVDLAMGHNAIYVHCGQDPTYCAPHLKDTDDYSIDSNNGGKRIPNGLSSEHTLYTYGNDLFGYLSKKFKTTISTSKPWQSFVSADETVTLSGGTANQVSVNFSPSYNTTFKYDAEAKTYVRYSFNNIRKDYVSGETVTAKNIFILMTNISTYPDGKHRKVALNGGNGYYITNGTYAPISWSKGDASSPITLTDASGNELKVSAGNSWVLLPDSSTSQPSFQ